MYGSRKRGAAVAPTVFVKPSVKKDIIFILYFIVIYMTMENDSYLS